MTSLRMTGQSPRKIPSRLQAAPVPAGERDEDILERRRSLPAIDVAYLLATQETLDRAFPGCLLSQDVDRLSEDGRVEDSGQAPQQNQRPHRLIAKHLEPPRPGRGHLRELFEILGPAPDHET